MTQPIQISKSQYIKGKQCSLSLWCALNRKDLTPPVDAAKQAMFDAGNEVGEWAKKYFSNGIEVKEPYYKAREGAEATAAFIKAGHAAIFEATAIHPDGSYSRIDILRKSPGLDGFDLIEVKGSTGVKEYHVDDLSFQYRVFTGAGYKINHCFMMLIDNQYVRQGEIDPQKLFRLEDITAAVLAKQPEVEAIAARLAMLDPADEPKVSTGAHCFKPFECDYMAQCWKGVPDYSIYSVFDKKKAEVMVENLGSYEVKSLPAALMPKGRKGQDIRSYISGARHIPSLTTSVHFWSGCNTRYIISTMKQSAPRYRCLTVQGRFRLYHSNSPCILRTAPAQNSGIIHSCTKTAATRARL